jgi:hypothetical protein
VVPGRPLPRGRTMQGASWLHLVEDVVEPLLELLPLPLLLSRASGVGGGVGGCAESPSTIRSVTELRIR